MREPNFSEAQLQQAVNIAYVRKIFELQGQWPFPHIPSLVAEYDLGWDTAFYLDWLSNTASSDDEGCNFFLQYKLSGELTSPGAREWSHWSSPYFRFKIPHSTRDLSGQFIDDYHQWDRLKALADKAYPTFYATNSTLQKAALQRTLQAGSLLDRIPLLDVRTVTALHKHVTFTSVSPSGVFALHSEKEESKMLTFAGALDALANGRQSSMSSSSAELLSALKDVGGNDASWQSDLSRISASPDRPLPARLGGWLQQSLIASFVRKHLGAELLWLPARG